MRFLISRLSSLGDVVCSLPVAGALKRSFEGCEVVWAVDRRFSGVVECCRSVDRVVVWPKEWRAWRGLWRELGAFDAALDLQGLLKSALVLAGAKAERKLGYHWQREGAWLFSQRVLPDPTSFHVVDQYVDVARAAGADAHGAEFDLAPKAEDVEAMRGVLAEAGWDGARPLALCNAGAGWASKRWPAAHFAALARKLQAEGVAVGFLGAPGDRPAFEEVLACEPGPVLDLLGKTKVRQLIALISLARVHVGGDTGSTHIAAALGVPAVGLYSITRPQRSCPYGQAERCLFDPDGLARIQPEAVLAKAMDALG